MFLSSKLLIRHCCREDLIPYSRKNSKHYVEVWDNDTDYGSDNPLPRGLKRVVVKGHYLEAEDGKLGSFWMAVLDLEERLDCLRTKE